jgi:hypothetical protein
MPWFLVTVDSERLMIESVFSVHVFVCAHAGFALIPLRIRMAAPLRADQDQDLAGVLKWHFRPGPTHEIQTEHSPSTQDGGKQGRFFAELLSAPLCLRVPGTADAVRGPPVGTVLPSVKARNMLLHLPLATHRPAYHWSRRSPQPQAATLPLPRRHSVTFASLSAENALFYGNARLFGDCRPFVDFR